MTKEYGERKRLSKEESKLIDDFRLGRIKKSEKRKWIEDAFEDEYGIPYVQLTGECEWVDQSPIWRRIATKKNILVVGDLHAPFIRKGYLEHCMRVRDKYRCNHTIFIGDIVDNHYASFHAPIPSGSVAWNEA